MDRLVPELCLRQINSNWYQSWRLFLFQLFMCWRQFLQDSCICLADTYSYPASAQLMKKMLKHKLEVEIDGIGNDLTYAEQLIQFIKNQVAASTPSA
ncbi:hypothetical protein Tco_1125285 [Tanacetum coccineum]|uniref:Uncharacterized protein n=1 Tax=Tanacetum coccineum TaxID=301880 RepID=A0ABQ5JAA2_9ASTR